MTLNQSTENPPALPPKPSVRIRSQLMDLMQDGNTTQDLCTNIVESHHPSKLNQGFNVSQTPPDSHRPSSGKALSQEIRYLSQEPVKFGFRSSFVLFQVFSNVFSQIFIG